MTQHQPPHRRHGFTLIEMIVTITSGSFLLMLAIGLVHQTMTLSSMSRQRAEQQQSIQRLGDQLRSDVHQARSATSAVAQSVQLAMNDRAQIIYVASPNGVRRERRTEDAATVQYEVYPLVNSQIAFALLDQPLRVELVIERPSPAGLRLEGHVVAVTSRLLHLEGITSETETP